MRLVRAALLCLMFPVLAFAAEIEGTYSASVKDGKVDLTIQYDHKGNGRSASTHGVQLRIADFQGLTEGQARSATLVPVTFELRRAEGVARFEGTFRDGKGSGHFAFTPDASYPAALESAGVVSGRRELDAKKQLLLLMLDYPIANVRELRQLGFGPIDVDEFVKLAIFRVTPAMVREFRAAGYENLSLDKLVELKIHGITLDYLRDVQTIGAGAVSLDEAVPMKIHGVTPQYVRDLASLGYKNLTPDQLVEMRIFRVTPEFIRELSAAGYDNLPVKKLVQLRIHGADEVLLKRK